MRKSGLLLLITFCAIALCAGTKEAQDASSHTLWIYPKEVPHHQQNHRSWKLKPYIGHDQQGKEFHLWIEAMGYGADKGCCNSNLLFITDNTRLTLENKEGRLQCGYAAIPGMSNCAEASWEFPVSADFMRTIANSKTVELTIFSKERGKQIAVKLSKEQIAVFQEMLAAYESLTVESKSKTEQ